MTSHLTWTNKHVRMKPEKFEFDLPLLSRYDKTALICELAHTLFIVIVATVVRDLEFPQIECSLVDGDKATGLLLCAGISSEMENRLIFWEEKEDIWLSTMTKSPFTNRKFTQKKEQQNATKMFNYTAIAKRLRTVLWLIWRLFLMAT